MIRTMLVDGDEWRRLADVVSRLLLSVNDKPVWGHAPGSLLLERVWWDKRFSACCQPFFAVGLEFGRAPERAFSGQYRRECWFNIQEAVPEEAAA